MDEEIKKVSWLELFYDLAFVALVAQLTYSLADHHKTLGDLLTVGLVGYMIFIAWIGTTVNRNIRDGDSLKDKLLIQLQMVLAFLMSITLPGMFEGNFFPFLIGFVLIRVTQLFMLHTFYRDNPERAPRTKNVFWGSVLAVCLWAIAGFVALPYLYVVTGMALAIDIASPLTRARGKENRVLLLNISHIQERLGLFLILVMGESMLVVALANTSVDVGVTQPVIVLSGIIFMITLWWSYFSYMDVIAEGKRPSSMFSFLHAHAFLFGGVVLLAAAYKNFLKHETFEVSDYLLLIGGMTVISVALVIIRNTIEVRNVLRSGTMRIMSVGTPVVGYIGYISNDVVFALTLITSWIVLLTIYDEWKRVSGQEAA